MTVTVADAMVTIPKTEPARLSVVEARVAFADPKVHLLLLVREGRLDTTLVRADLTVGAEGAARRYGTTVGRVTAPGVPLAEAERWMRRSGARRLAVITDDDTLVGLLCLKASGTGFCSDAGVRARMASA